MIRPTLVEQLAVSRRRERYLLALFAGSWAGHLLASHATLAAQTLAALFVLLSAGIFAGVQVLGIVLDSLRFRRVPLIPSPRHTAPASVKPESQPGPVSALQGMAGAGPTEWQL